MREKIFVPLKMKNTYFFSETSKIPDSIRTAGHDEKMRKLLPEQFDKVKGDKGIFSTTNDLFLFMEAYYNHKLLNKDLLLAATTPKSREKKKSNYGYGWRMKEYETPEKVVFHNGWWRGYRTALHRIYKDSTTVVVLTNNLLNTAYRVKDFVDVMNGIKPNSKDSEHPNEH
jgi:CubicO group peptidase (beta-lactamase class C family)